MDQQAALEQHALEQLRRGDLRAAHHTLSTLLRYRPNDSHLRNRIQQVEHLVKQREEAQARIQAEPLRYAHAYIQAGRLVEGLKLLRAALAKDPANQRLRDLALEVAARLRKQAEASQRPQGAMTSPPAPNASARPAPHPFGHLPSERPAQRAAPFAGVRTPLPASPPSVVARAPYASTPPPAASAPPSVPSTPPSPDLGHGLQRRALVPSTAPPRSSVSGLPADSESVRQEAIRRAQRDAEARARTRGAHSADNPVRQQAIAKAKAAAEARARGIASSRDLPLAPLNTGVPARNGESSSIAWTVDLTEDVDDLEQTEVGPPPSSPNPPPARAEGPASLGANVAADVPPAAVPESEPAVELLTEIVVEDNRNGAPDAYPPLRLVPAAPVASAGNGRHQAKIAILETLLRRLQQRSRPQD